MGSLKGKTIFVSGGSRGIGLAIAVSAAKQGANIALLAKTGNPHPKLEGTVYTAAEAIEAAGGSALPMVGDVRNEEDVVSAVDRAVTQFGAIDICINNASAISLEQSESLPMKRFDLMQTINTRGTFLLSRTCVPHLRKATNPHVLTLSPPLNMDPKWFALHLGYTLSKYGMSMCTHGMAAEFAADGIAFNSLWPRTFIATAAVSNLMGGDAAMSRARGPEIMADAALAIFARDSRSATGNFYIDDDVLREEGVNDFSHYSEGDDLQPDIFIDA
jgi:citronellol/citronellal dehydrogenase